MLCAAITDCDAQGAKITVSFNYDYEAAAEAAAAEAARQRREADRRHNTHWRYPAGTLECSSCQAVRAGWVSDCCDCCFIEPSGPL